MIENDDYFTIDELMVSDYLIMEKTEKEIAKKLDMPLKTVKIHCLSIYEKLDVKDRKDFLAAGRTMITPWIEEKAREKREGKREK